MVVPTAHALPAQGFFVTLPPLFSFVLGANVMSPWRPFAAAGVLLAALASPSALAAASGPAFGVFLRLADGPAGSFAAMTAAVPATVEKAGMRLLATTDVETGCRFKATVFVVEAPAYTAKVLEGGVRNAFALPLRLAVYEDERGVHLALADPRTLGRTVVAESFEGPPAEVVAALERAVKDGFPGTPVAQGYGQQRDRGLIGKTMGVVAGGPFPGKVEELGAVKASATRGPREVADAIAALGATPTRRWGTRFVYRAELPGTDAILLGFTGGKVESKSFAIVGEGTDEGRKGLACPGVDHAAAYPFEVLVVREEGKVRVLAIDVMFRMKMYFEDAGPMKFAANMAMPGSIEDELRDLVEEALEQAPATSASR